MFGISRKNKKYKIKESNDIKSLEDNELVELIKNDLNYFEELVERYEKKLYGFIKKISYFGKEDIEDILQEIFIKVYKNINSYDTDLKFSSWIYQIARNHTYDAIRKAKARPNEAGLNDEEILQLISSGLDIKTEIESKDALKRIKLNIQDLPYKYREVLILRFIENKSYKEIMDILKKSKGGIATLLSRGRKMLQKKLSQNKE